MSMLRSMLGRAPNSQGDALTFHWGDGVGLVRMEQIIADSLAARVQQRMAALGLNPFSTAKRAGLKSGYVHDILRGKVLTPGADKLDSLAVALETSTSFLLGKSEARLGVYGVSDPSASPPLFASTPQTVRPAPAQLLPIRFELAADVWRTATEVSGQPLGFHAADIPAGLAGREHWYEYVRDDSFSALIPRGAIVQVCDVSPEDVSGLQEGDVVVVVKRLYSTDPPIHLVERSLRRLVRDRSGWGMLFFALATGDPARDWTDEPFRDVYSAPGPDKEASYAAPPTPHSPEAQAVLSRRERSLDSKEHMDAFIAEHAANTPRVVGRVVRAVLPISKLGGFGLSS